MKILHLINTFAPIGGVETYVLNLLPVLETKGHENVIVYRNDHARTPPGTSRTVYHVPVTEDAALDTQRIAECIERERPSVIYVHDVDDPVLLERVAQLAPTVGYIHIFYPVCPGLGKLYRRGDEVCQRPFGLGCAAQIYWRRCASARHPRNVYRIMQRTAQFLRAYQGLPRIIVASNYMKSLMIQNQFEPGRVEILPPHFVTEIGQNHSMENGADHPRQILFAGRLEYEKGLPYLLEALQRVQTSYSLLVAGDGTRKTEYLQLAQTLGISDRVQFCGWLSEDELKQAYQRSCVTVMPTLMPEPFGKVGIEAMANGCAVLAFDVGGISDWLKDGFNGYLLPAGDADRLASKLDKLLVHPDLARQLGANGQEYVQKQYAPDVHTERLLQIFQSLTN